MAQPRVPLTVRGAGLCLDDLTSLLSWSGHSQRQRRNEPLQEKKRKENSLLPRRNTVLFENSWGLGLFVLVFNPQSLKEVCAHCSPIKHLRWKRTLPAPAPAIRAALIPSSTRPGAAAEPRSTPRPLGQRSNGKAALHRAVMRTHGRRTAALRSAAPHQPRSPSVIWQSHRSAALPSPGQRAATKAARHSCAPPSSVSHNSSAHGQGSHEHQEGLCLRASRLLHVQRALPDRGCGGWGGGRTELQASFPPAAPLILWLLKIKVNTEEEPFWFSSSAVSVCW